MKELRNMKGITLIALVITIVILLLLAGVTIAMLTGENGILTKAQNAKGNWNAKQAKEQIELVVTDAKIHNNGMSINKQILKDGLIGLGVENLPENAEDITFDLSVTLNNYLFKIYENGKVEQVTGIQIPSSIKLIPGETIEINVDKSEDVSGTVTWNVENENITTIDTDTGDIITVTAKGVGETLITATIQTNGTTYTAKCNVKVVAAITSLNLSNAEVQSGNTVQLQITKTPQGETENVIFESSNPDVLTVDNNGLLTAKSGILEDTIVKITARTERSNIETSCNVSVLAPVTAPPGGLFKYNEQIIDVGSSLGLYSGSYENLFSGSIDEMAVFGGYENKIYIKFDKKYLVSEVQLGNAGWGGSAITVKILGYTNKECTNTTEIGSYGVETTGAPFYQTINVVSGGYYGIIVHYSTPSSWASMGEITIH